MHELGIVSQVLKSVWEVARNYPDRKVRSVYLKVGMLRAIEPEVMRLCWDAASKETFAGGAELVLDLVPTTGGCRRCGMVFGAEDLFFICPACGVTDVETLRGKELILERVKMD